MRDSSSLKDMMKAVNATLGQLLSPKDGEMHLGKASKYETNIEIARKLAIIGSVV